MSNNEERTKELSRMSQALLNSYRNLTAIIMHTPRVYQDDPDLIVKTDGRVVKVGPKFFNDYTPQEQSYLLTHICLHTALRHHVRAQQIQHNDVALKVWNIVTDVIVDNALKDITSEAYLRRPKNHPCLNDLTKLIDLTNIKLTAENLFTALMANINKQGKSQGMSMENLLGMATNDFEPDDFPDSTEISKTYGTHTFLDAKLEDMVWNERIRKLAAGSSPGSSLFNLLNELPEPIVPWQQILKQYLFARLSPDKYLNWKRPSRRYSAGVTDIYEPYQDKTPGLRTCALLLDLSGSCWNKEIIGEFFANIEQVQKITKSNVVLISFDSEVHEVELITSSQSITELVQAGTMKLTGGGGTNFIPPFEEALKHNPDIIVYFTDCYGEFPEPISHPPVLWASVGQQAPWGINIKLTNEDY